MYVKGWFIILNRDTQNCALLIYERPTVRGTGVDKGAQAPPMAGQKIFFVKIE